MKIKKENFYSVLIFPVILEIITAVIPYDPHLKIGNVNIDLPKSPPRNEEIKELYDDAEIFAHRYDKRLRSLENFKKSIRSAKKFEYDFNKDLNHLKSHIRQIRENIPSPSLNDANLFQLVNEFVRKLAMIPIQTHCFIYGCPVMTPATPFYPSTTEHIDQPPQDQTDEPDQSPPDDVTEDGSGENQDFHF